MLRKCPFPMIGAAVAAAMLVTGPRLTAGQTNGTPERFTAAAIDPNRGRSASIEIAIDRWTTDAERDKFMSVLLEKGPEKLLDVLQDAKKVGYIRRTGSLSWDLRYARRTPLPDSGERVVVVTDRPISFFEATNQPRTLDYPFTVVELHLNRDGEGEGKMSLATKITADAENKIITLENWDIQPVLLGSVKRERRSH